MSPSQPAPDAQGRWWRVAAIAALAVALLAPLAGAPPVTNPNELVRVELAVALAVDGTVDLEGPALVYGLSEDVARHDGRVLADKAPGLSLMAVPVLWLAGGLLPTVPGTDLPSFWPLRHLLTALLVGLATILLAVVVLPRLAGSAADHAAPVAVVAVVCTPLWTYGTVFFGHATAAALVAAAWLLLLGRPAGEGGVGTAAAGGVIAGLAVATEYPTAVLVLVMAVTLLVRRTSPARIAAAVGGIGLGALPMLLYHWAAFGSPWLTGYAFKADPGFAEIHGGGVSGIGLPTAEALWGVLVGSSRGLLFYSPLLLLAPVGLWLMVRRTGWREAGPLTAAAVLYVAFAAGFSDWQAGWGAAARHLVPVVPLLLVPTVAAAFHMARRPLGLAILAVLAAASATRTALTVAVSPFLPPEVARPLAELVLPSLADGALHPTLPGALLGVPDWTVHAVVAGLAAAALTWALARLGGGGRRWRPVAVLVLAVVALQVGWLAWRGGRPAPEREALRAQWLVMVGQEDAGRRLAAELAAVPP